MNTIHYEEPHYPGDLDIENKIRAGFNGMRWPWLLKLIETMMALVVISQHLHHHGALRSWI